MASGHVRFAAGGSASGSGDRISDPGNGGGGGGWITRCGAGAGNSGVDSGKRACLKTSRRDESIADEWALRYWIGPAHRFGLADFMRRLSAQNALPESRQSSIKARIPGRVTGWQYLMTIWHKKKNMIKVLPVEDMRLTGAGYQAGGYNNARAKPCAARWN